MKKIISLALLLTFILSFASCGKDATVPDGMQRVSGDDVPYDLFVPGGWNPTSSNGICGAYYSQSDKSSITVSSYSPTGTMASIDDYWQFCLANYEGTYKDFEVEEESTPIVFGGKSAFKYVFRATVGGAEYRFMQIISVHANRYYLLTYTSDAEHYDLHTADVDKTVSEFIFK